MIAAKQMAIHINATTAGWIVGSSNRRGDADRRKFRRSFIAGMCLIRHAVLPITTYCEDVEKDLTDASKELFSDMPLCYKIASRVQPFAAVEQAILTRGVGPMMTFIESASKDTCKIALTIGTAFLQSNFRWCEKKKK